MAKTRLSKHIGSATLDSQADTTKPVGRHFRLPGHDSSHMKFLVFEKVFSRDRHVLEARERFWREQYDYINKTQALVRLGFGNSEKKIKKIK